VGGEGGRGRGERTDESRENLDIAAHGLATRAWYWWGVCDSSGSTPATGVAAGTSVPFAIASYFSFSWAGSSRHMEPRSRMSSCECAGQQCGNFFQRARRRAVQILTCCDVNVLALRSAALLSLTNMLYEVGTRGLASVLFLP